MITSWIGRKFAITGIAGTVGKELLRQLLSLGPAEIIGIDNNESELFFLAETYKAQPQVKLYLGDVRDRDSLTGRFRGCDGVFHVAALKHVGLCEMSPREATRTNIEGTQNVIEAATQAGVSRIVLSSSDKAVNPTNVMGTSKLMAERLMTAADFGWSGAKPVCCSVRFGNVMGSRGSVIPLFRRQILAGGPVTLTHPDMTRFVMTLKDAVRLLLGAASRAHGGEVFVTKMSAIRIEDLAWAMIEELAPTLGRRADEIAIKTTGLRTGEKMFEELMNEEEAVHAVEDGDYLVILPRHRFDQAKPEEAFKKPYNSAQQKPMSCEELRSFLRENALLTEEH